MNRRDKKSTKILEFEPRMPEAPPAVPEGRPGQAPRPRDEEAPAMKGCYAPVTFFQTPAFDPEEDGFILNLPDSLLGGSLVMFDDGSFGIEKDGITYECDSSHLFGSMVVELEEASVSKSGNAGFVITGYQTPASLDA